LCIHLYNAASAFLWAKLFLHAPESLVSIVSLVSFLITLIHIQQNTATSSPESRWYFTCVVTVTAILRKNRVMKEKTAKQYKRHSPPSASIAPREWWFASRRPRRRRSPVYRPRNSRARRNCCSVRCCYDHPRSSRRCRAARNPGTCSRGRYWWNFARTRSWRSDPARLRCRERTPPSGSRSSSRAASMM